MILPGEPPGAGLRGDERPPGHQRERGHPGGGGALPAHGVRECARGQD